MSDSTLDEIQAEVDHRLAGLDARARARYQNLVDRWGIPSLAARTVDLASIAIGVAMGGFAISGELGIGVRFLLFAVALVLTLGGVFGFLNGLEPAEVDDAE